jgi:hypothetical protein
MCVSSMVGDHYYDKWKEIISPSVPVSPFPNAPYGPPHQGPIPMPGQTFDPSVFQAPVSREEFEQLRKDVMEMKELLKKAIQYDIIHDEPACENEEKYEFLRKVAALVEVNLEDILPKKK